MPDKKLVPDSYKRLVTDIASLYEGARKALIEAYWEIGKRIVLVEQRGEIRAAYGTSLLVKISEDLSKRVGNGFSLRNLERMRAFYLQNPNSAPAPKLSLAHHFALLPVRDKKKRQQLEARAVREGLKRDELRLLVRQELVREQVAQNLARETPGVAGIPTPGVGRVRSEEATPYIVSRALLTPIRGTLYAYRILDPKTVQPKEEGLLLLDLGFSCYRDLDAVTSKVFKPGDIVESVKTGDDVYSIRHPSSSIQVLYTYQATVEKVVDGDTLRVVVDLGFNTRTRQYLRLRGIDCPEMDTPEGKQAADFVRSRIKTADQIVLTSSKSDKYDRYLADIYFTDPNGQEIFLNNLLLQEGLAVRMGE
jgi:hypothetical protein